MLSPERVEQINKLVRKKKENGLSETEEQEQIGLRKKYLGAFRSGMCHHIGGMKVVDPKGNDVAPEKLKEVQKKRGLHNRDDSFQ